MGAQQSSRHGEASPGSAPTKACYYDLLAVDRQATDEEIKKAYRKKALELHPDRNYTNAEEATQKFAQVQTAYEVLSDPQERAWYDSHRESILKGNEGLDDDGEPTTFRNVRLTPAEEIHSLVRRFNASVPFSDEPNGFFGITRETFEHLALEEEAASDFDGAYCPEYPDFGSSDDDYESVVKPFYVAWTGFSTRKSFAWKDKYRLSDAPDRQVRRLMEKENKKLRDDAIREFNDAVRFLVVFVRKRDPRYIPNAQTDAERQKTLRDAAAAQATRARAANQEKMATHQVADWAQSREDSGAEEHFPESEEEVDSEEVEVLECVICDKIFKSEKQLEAHEKSRKHTKALQQLRWRMKKEGAELDLESKPPWKPSSDAVEESRLDGEQSGEGDVPVFQHNLDRESASGQLRSTLSETEATSTGSSSDDYAPRNVIADRLAPDDSIPVTLPATTNTIDSNVDRGVELPAAVGKMCLEDTPPQSKVGKAKAKRERKAAQSSAQHSDEHRCTVCAQEFTSRSKLFQHIRDEEHAAQVVRKPKSGKKSRAKR